MARAELLYFPGSPFARMARVLVREWALPVDEVELPFPPPPGLFDLNPLGQVPVLTEPGRPPLFPTALILERLWDMAGQPADAWRPDDDRQVLATILLAGDAMVSALFQDWAGLERTGRDAIGYDPGARNLDRFDRVLDWCDARAGQGALGPGLTIPTVALACLLLWSDARTGPVWRDRAALARLVDGLAARDAFRATAPQRWSPDA